MAIIQYSERDANLGTTPNLVCPDCGEVQKRHYYFLHIHQEDAQSFYLKEHIIRCLNCEGVLSQAVIDLTQDEADQIIAEHPWVFGA